VDAGFKALPGWKITPQPLCLDGVNSISFSAEHGVLMLKAPNTDLAVGQPLDFIVGYGDETICLYDELYGMRQEEVEVVWPILGRGRVR
jgi:D-serine deaminase-like pyridoxal phosphate-dependent protein